MLNFMKKAIVLLIIFSLTGFGSLVPDSKGGSAAIATEIQLPKPPHPSAPHKPKPPPAPKKHKEPKKPAPPKPKPLPRPPRP